MHYEIIVACFLALLILIHYFLRSYLHKIALNIFFLYKFILKNAIVIYSKNEEIFNYNTI